MRHLFTGPNVPVPSIRQSRSLTRRPPLFWVAAAVVLNASLAVASIPDANGVFHGCYKKGDSNLRIIDTATTRCKSNETEVTWSQQGPVGQTGATGPSDAYVADQKGSFGAVPISTSTATPILTLAAVPPGSYVLFATAAISGNATFSTTSCSLTRGDGSTLSAYVQATIGGGSGFTFGSVPINTSITLASTTDIVLSCRSSGTNVVSQPSTITAIKVGAIH